MICWYKVPLGDVDDLRDPGPCHTLKRGNAGVPMSHDVMRFDDVGADFDSCSGREFLVVITSSAGHRTHTYSGCQKHRTMKRAYCCTAALVISAYCCGFASAF